VREETRKRITYCAFCKLPITREQRPSVQLDRRREVHVECYTKMQKDEEEKNKNPGE
jgi:hypothetical protein